MLNIPIRDGIQQSASLHLVEEIGHRVLNEYDEAICSLAVAASKSSDPLAQHQMEGAAAILGSYADMHRALMPPHHRGKLNLGDYIARICRAMLTSALAQRGVQIVLRTDEIFLPADRCWRLGLIIAELVRNAAEHGFSGGSGSITIDISNLDGELSCVVYDDGAGISVNSGGRGRRIVKLLAADLGGLIGFASGASGSRAQLNIPADEIIAL